MRILEWDTDAATTRQQVPYDERREGLKISYKNPEGEWINEQYDYNSFDSLNWGSDNRWIKAVTNGQIDFLSPALPLAADIFRFGDYQTLESTIFNSSAFNLSSQYTTLLCRVKPQSGKYRVILEEGITFQSYAVFSSVPDEIKINEDLSDFIINTSTRLEENSSFAKDEGGNYVALSVKGIPTSSTYFEPVPYKDTNDPRVEKIEASLSSLDNEINNANDAITDINTKINGKRLSINNYDKNLNNAIINGTTIVAINNYTLCFYEVEEKEMVLTVSDLTNISVSFSAYLAEMPDDGQLKYNTNISSIYLQKGNFVEGGQGFVKPEGCKCIAISFLSTATEETRINIPSSVGANSDDIKKIITENVDMIAASMNGKTIPSHIFYGKKVIFIGDSLMASPRSVPPLVSQYLGLQYDDTEHAQTCIGGTTTLSTSDTCGMMRARKIAGFEIKPEIIIHENVNDSGWATSTSGTSEDEPYMLSKFYDIDTGKNSLKAAKEYFTQNFSNFISTFSEEIGAMIRIKYISQSFLFTISSGATSKGVVNIKLKNRTFGIEINGNENISEIVELIAIQPFDEIGCSIGNKTENSITIVNNNDEPILDAEFDTNSTGIIIQTIDNNSDNYGGYCFTSHDNNDWENVEKWKWYRDLTLWSIYKGYFEYLITTFPKSWIMIMITPDWYSFDWNNPDPSWLREDNTWDWDKVKKYLDDWHYGKLNSLYREVAKYMNIPILDLEKESGINIYNASQFYPVNNVHFNQKEEGIKRIAQTIARCLLR